MNEQINTDLLITEYNVVLEYIKMTSNIGLENQIPIYNLLKVGKKHKETDKENVMFQTDFIENVYTDFLFNGLSEKSALSKLQDWYDDIIIRTKDINWAIIISHAQPNNLEQILNSHYNTMPHSVYWQLIAHAYTSSNLAHSDEELIIRLLNDTRPDKEFLMDEEERLFFNQLPEQITIFRGCSKKEIESGNFRMSWTLDKKTAEFFAYKYVNFIFEDSLEKDKTKYGVVEKIVNKSEVIAYFGGRNEKEILYLGK